VQQAVIMGLVFGTMYATTRSLSLSIVTHIVFDLTALWMIYNGLEARIAGAVFK
jgi:membrane protease YdiL (CAAX protease family)